MTGTDLKGSQSLSNKDILIAYCSTLSDERARRAFKMLREEFEIDRTKTIRLNVKGNVDDSGLIRMTRRQYNKMVRECGEYKFHWLVECLHNYITHLKEQADLGDARAKRMFKLYTQSSCYPRLMKGWVMERYNRDATPPLENIGIDFFSIDSGDKAIEYIKSMPLELIASSPELEFLATKYPKVVKYMEKVLDE
jgi:hypothetical protein